MPSRSIIIHLLDLATRSSNGVDSSSGIDGFVCSSEHLPTQLQAVFLSMTMGVTRRPSRSVRVGQAASADVFISLMCRPRRASIGVGWFMDGGLGRSESDCSDA